MALRSLDYDRDYYGRERWGRSGVSRSYRGGRDRTDRGLIDRAGDEVRSWFGDEEAERRRRVDERRTDRSIDGRADSLGDIRASDVMTEDVVWVRPDESIQRAAQIMRECDCGALPVLGRGGRVIGMITDRDIVVRLIATGAETRNALVEDCMTDDVIACHENDSLVECMRVMSREQIRRLPIIDNRGRLSGIVSQADLARHTGDDQRIPGERRAFADVLCAVSEPRH